MTFSENTNLTPSGQSASPSKIKELENRIDDLQQTVTSVADSVADLADEVNTHELNADTANIGNAVIDNATVGTETVTTVNADTVNADNLNATDASVTNLTADDIEANSVDADNGYFGSANAQSFTGQGVNITGDITASNKVQGKTVQATEKVVTPALESTNTELKGATTVRGDVYFPEDGDKIYGEYLEIEADKVKADIEAETVNATSVTAGTVTGTAIEAQGLLVTGNSRFMGEVQARDIVPEPGQTLDITTDTLDADSIDADTVKVNSLTTETPVDTNFLVGYDENGELIPVDASLDPANLWEQDPDEEATIRPKNNRSVSVEALIADEAELTNASATDFAAEAITAEDVTITGTLAVSDSVEVGGNTTLQNVTTEDATVNGDISVTGDATLKDTEVDGTLTVNGDIIQNGSAYETHAEKLYTKKDIIITRDGAVSGLSTGEYTGIQAKKYDGTNDGLLVFDKDGEARVGDMGNTQPILTRDEVASMTAGRPLTWDGTNKKAVCGSAAQSNALNSGITSALVTKLNGIETGAEVNVQADWSTTDTSADSYIKNKPSIPTTWGTAAEKNAGTSAGYVPLIGTTLGTTNNNIVVTDTSGQLKPSGTAIGSAAGKTAGSAAGNVPLIGTALGTTNNNIVVTDTSGQLKPSGTTLGTSAGKTAGSEAGNVPLIGTALGTTNNNIVVTDTSGQLKPSGTVIGSAAGKTAGSAVGNVPLVGTALGTTNGNLVATDASGALKPVGLTAANIAYWGNGGAVCSTAKTTAAKVVGISGFTLYTGVTVKVMFTYSNMTANPTLNVNSTGAKAIKVVKAGSKVTPTNKTGYWRGATLTSLEMWQPYTTLELLYDGTDWVIMGNPVVESYYTDSASYEIKADGLIRQFGEYTNNGDTLITTTLPVQFSTSSKVLVTGFPNVTTLTSESSTDNIFMSKTLTTFSTKWHSHDTRWSINWEAIGY